MTARAAYLLIAFCWSSGLLWSQSGYRWAISGGSDGYFDTGLDVDVDAAGNTYLAAEYEDRTTFLDTLLYSQGAPDLMVAKLSPTGELVWLTTAGSTVHDRAAAVDAAPDGSVWMAGYGKIPYPASKSSAMHTRDALIARYRADGSFAWGRYMDGDQYSESRDVVGNAAGDAFLTGVIKTMGWYGTDTIQGNGLEDAFLVSFDSAGALRWVKAIGGPGRDEAWKVAIDPAGNLVLAGTFSLTADFGGTTATASGVRDGFIAKYSPAGTLLWVRPIGGPGEDELNSVEVSADGSIYFAGDFTDSIVTSVGTIRGRSDADLCYGKLDAAGNLVWLKAAGGVGMDIPQDLDVDPFENVYFGGYFFGNLRFDTIDVASVAFDNLFWVKLDSNGALQLLETALYADSRDVIGIAVDPAQNVVLTGLYGQLIQLGPYTLPAVLGTIDFFVAKYATAAFAVQIDSVAGSPYCGSDLFTVHMQVAGLPESGNVFYLELSDAFGSFAHPDTVGQFAGQLTGSIQGQVPLGLSGGSGYRMRVVCSAPAFISADNGYDIALNPNTAVPVAIQGDTLLCNGIPLLLYVDQGLSSQVWSTGDTAYFIYVTQPGPVWVEGQDASGCTNRDVVTVVPCVGLDEVLTPTWLRAYPNPADEQLYVRVGTTGRVSLQLFNGLGQAVIQCQDVPGTSDQLLDVSQLPAGIYHLKVTASGGSQVQRILLH